MAALLGEVGRCEIDGDALRRQRQTNGVQRAAHALAALGHGFIRQPDNGEGGEPGADLDLHVDSARFDPFESDRRDPREHRENPRPSPITLAKGPRLGKNNQRTFVNLSTGQGEPVLSDLVLGQSARLSHG